MDCSFASDFCYDRNGITPSPKKRKKKYISICAFSINFLEMWEGEEKAENEES